MAARLVLLGEQTEHTHTVCAVWLLCCAVLQKQTATTAAPTAPMKPTTEHSQHTTTTTKYKTRKTNKKKEQEKRDPICEHTPRALYSRLQGIFLCFFPLVFSLSRSLIPYLLFPSIEIYMKMNKIQLHIHRIFECFFRFSHLLFSNQKKNSHYISQSFISFFALATAVHSIPCPLNEIFHPSEIYDLLDGKKTRCEKNRQMK